MAKTIAPTKSIGVNLRATISCPQCWHEFAPEDVLWVSSHPDLQGDPRLGDDAQKRFLPTRFSPKGQAIDTKGMACDELACPKCHLPVPQALLEIKPAFASILGSPGSGKSYLLASMTWQMRKLLLSEFQLGFSDANTKYNRVLVDYEEDLFLASDPNRLVTIAKTEKEGDLYKSVSFGDQTVWYPQPFVFLIKPMESHVNYKRRKRVSCALCLYDNAGEHFLPGEESATHPGTQHLAVSSVLLFLFDPTQHPNFRSACKGHTRDPQLDGFGQVYRQDLVLQEAANRVRAKTGLPQDAKDPRPFIVIVTKYDIWQSLDPSIALKPLDIVQRQAFKGLGLLDSARIKEVSGKVRALLMELSPEFVVAAEAFSESVTYVPVSALGGSPEVVEGGKMLGVRPSQVKPIWAEVPLLFALHSATSGLVYTLDDLKRNRQGGG